MNNCRSCDFKTNNTSYNICPLCGEQMSISGKKMKYRMGLRAEESFDCMVEMTYEEALIVERVLNDLQSGISKGVFCGSVWIEGVHK